MNYGAREGPGSPGARRRVRLDHRRASDPLPKRDVAEGFDPAVVDQVVRLVDGAEYKRRQMPPGVRITTKAFGKDRRMPITNRYRSSALEELEEPGGG